MSLPEQMARCLSSAVIVVADNIVQIRTVRLLVNDDDRTAGENEIAQLLQGNVVALRIIDKRGNILRPEQFQCCAFLR